MAKTPSPLEHVGDRVRSFRKELGLTQEDLAYRAGVDRSYMGGIERGERNITILTLCQIADALEVEAASLLVKMPHRKRVGHKGGRS